MSTVRTLASLAAGTVATGAAGLGYAAGVERRHWTLRQVELPVLDPGARPLRILHLSDFHLTPGQRSKIRWIASLAALEPDLVIDTGDNLAHPDAVPNVLTALGPLFHRPGAFVFGSNDYYGPTAKNPARYLHRGDTRRVHGAPLPWQDLRAAFREHGWVDATHARHLLEVDGRTVRIAGVDDPHLNRDRYPRIAGHDADADLRLGLTHSPEPRVLDGFAADGYDLVLAGHTHGGQLRLPGYGAIVTNCGIDRSRARGASRWGSHTRLHVSAGLGTSPYAPVRFACPPEASLLTLVPPPTSADAGRATPAQAVPGVG
ncbi:putative secreted protein [Pseudonocardia sp. Ae168_Ps1]|uniref:metallophosphoesterase n=1 Tax=unclassified Pseudonocardia TaxID=2619320 RepID=UPI00094A9BAE|nr:MULTISPECIES: metallophosphoesterase [unclassified Pseudonocardia]OLL75266.1 putative secreted protein [Pseudonocardia sp. Ae150A_Ps1]OLL81260.1 putative secreted protein [Pseudonocardia sp. Ae168_Ps1]OLL84625.1 putative secreted protein [Pseudonocardia sp. Ae263_Ps1]OLL95358.1 putative secreted protein [Pseudonocardia sp. Ae356_Ps1]